MKKTKLIIFILIVIGMLLTSCSEHGILKLPEGIEYNTPAVSEAVPVPTPAPTRKPFSGAEFIYDNPNRPSPPEIDTDSCIVPAGESLVVRITAQSPGDRIYYTLDGTRPTSESNVYEGPFTVLKDGDRTKTLTAVAVNIFGLVSDTAGKFYQHPVCFRDPAVERIMSEYLDVEPGKILYRMLDGIESVYVNGTYSEVNIDKKWEEGMPFDPETKQFLNHLQPSGEKGSVKYLDDFNLMPDLRHLIVNNCAVEDVPAFPNLILDTLSLMDNDIRDISALKHHIYLDTLFLDNNAITDVTEVFGNTNSIMYASLSGNKIEKTDFSESPVLLYIWLDDTGLDEFPDFGYASAAQYIYLNDNNIRKPGDLTHFSRLEFLDLSNNQIEDISCIATPGVIRIVSGTNYSYDSNSGEVIQMNYEGCKELDLSGNNISDLAQLQYLYNLRKVYLRDNAVPITSEMLEGLGENLKVIID